MTYEEASVVANKLRQTFDPRELGYREVAIFCELALRSAWRDKMDAEEELAKEAA